MSKEGDGEAPGRICEDGRVVGGVYKGDADCCRVDAAIVIN